MVDVDNFLAHFGIKGMRWGVRREKQYAKNVSAISTSENLNKQPIVRFGPKAPKIRNEADLKLAQKVVNETAQANMRAMDSAINSLNKGAAGKILREGPSSEDRLRRASDVLRKEFRALDPDHTHEVGFNFKTGDIMIVTTPKGGKLKHAEISEDGVVTRRIHLTFDDEGNFVRADLVSDEMEESMTDVDNFLAHFGIKGMRWGVRRERGPDGTVGSTQASNKELSDYEKAREISARAKRSGTKSLTNQEMQMLVNRINLEQQYSRLTAKPSSLHKGREFVKEQLKTGKTVNELLTFVNSPAGRLLIYSMGAKTMGKHAKNIPGVVGKHERGRPLGK